MQLKHRKYSMAVSYLFDQPSANTEIVKIPTFNPVADVPNVHQNRQVSGNYLPAFLYCANYLSSTRTRKLTIAPQEGEGKSKIEIQQVLATVSITTVLLEASRVVVLAAL
jgi:hypothetical protein